VIEMDTLIAITLFGLVMDIITIFQVLYMYRIWKRGASVKLEIYCFECKDHVTVRKIYAWQLKDALDLQMTLSCGHEMTWTMSGKDRKKTTCPKCGKKDV